MADSYRLVALKALTEYLKGITKADGYENDLANSVYRGRTTFGDNDPVPLISILEAPRPDVALFAGEDGGQRAEDWNLLIQGWAADDVNNPTDPAYGLMNDVERRLFRLIACDQRTGVIVYPTEYLLGKKISSLTILPGVVRPPMAEVSSKAFFYLPIRVGLVRPTD